MPRKYGPMPKALQVYLLKKLFGDLDSFTFATKINPLYLIVILDANVHRYVLGKHSCLDLMRNHSNVEGHIKKILSARTHFS